MDAPTETRGVPYPDPDAAPPSTETDEYDGPREIRITVGKYVFRARLETQRAPASCRVLRTLLPLSGKLFQTRWSGEAAWVPLGCQLLEVDYENATSRPLPGEVLLFKGGISNPEIFIAYGASSFAGKVGPLAGNHVATIVDNLPRLREVGRLVLWEGAQDITIEFA